VIGFIYSLVVLISYGADGAKVFQRAADLTTCAVPPALPACMTIGISFALMRLKRKKVFCIQPTRINMSGNVQVFCFDKTGTLTEDGLSLVGVQSADATGYCGPYVGTQQLMRDQVCRHAADRGLRAARARRMV